MAKHSDYLKTLPLTDALWWYIENGGRDADSSEYFFALRERVREEPTNPPPVEQMQPDPLTLTDQELGHVVAALYMYSMEQEAELRDGNDWTKDGPLQGRFESHPRLTHIALRDLAKRLGGMT